MKIVIPDPIRIPEAIKDKLRAHGADVYDDLPETQAEVVERIKDAEIITANYFTVDKDLIDAAPKLKYIIVPSVGYDWVDHQYAAARGIKLINCPTFITLSVAEHTMALIFSLARHVVQANVDLREGIWSPADYEGVELGGKKLGLVGYGNIGQNVERMAKGIGMTTVHVNSKSTPAEIDELIVSSDVVVLCLPLNKTTRHMIDQRRLGLLKKQALLINVARGAIIDQLALVTALKNNQFAGAGLDVFENEALSGMPTAEIVELAKMPNVVATPHTAYNATGTVERLGAELLASIEACLTGNPKNIVN